MANEIRSLTDFIGGLVEDAPLLSGATTLTSAGLASLAAIGSTQFATIVLDPDGISGAPEIVLVTAHTAAATTATIARGARGTTARAHAQDTPWVHTVTKADFDGSGGGSGLIGVKNYRNGSDTGIALTVGASQGDVDATNLVVSFTGPPSGIVIVTLTTYAASSTSNMYWNLRDGSGDIADTLAFVTVAGGDKRISYRCYKAGLTPGTAYSWKWGARVTAGVGSIYTGPAYGPALMEVWAVNV